MYSLESEQQASEFNMLMRFTGNQCRSDGTGVTWSYLQEHVIRRAAAFCID